MNKRDKDTVFGFIWEETDSGVYYDFVKASKSYDETLDPGEKDLAKKRMDDAFTKLYKDLDWRTQKLFTIQDCIRDLCESMNDDLTCIVPICIKEES